MHIVEKRFHTLYALRESKNTKNSVNNSKFVRQLDHRSMSEKPKKNKTLRTTERVRKSMYVWVKFMLVSEIKRCYQFYAWEQIDFFFFRFLFSLFFNPDQCSAHSTFGELIALVWTVTCPNCTICINGMDIKFVGTAIYCETRTCTQIISESWIDRR